MDQFANRLEQKRQQHRQEREVWRERMGWEATRAIPLPELDGLSVAEALHAYAGWASGPLAQARQAYVAARLDLPAAAENDAGPAALAAELARKPAARQLTYVDDLVEKLFDIRRIFPHIRHQTDIFYCRTAAEFVRPLAVIGLPSAQQEALIAQGEAGDWSGPVLSHVAYYLPDEGCYVNGALLAAGCLTANGDPEKAVDDPETFFRAVAAIARTMWGWGFLIDYSHSGQKRKANGLWRQEVAAQLGLPPLETMSYPPLLAELQTYAQLVEPGWMMWITETITQAARRHRLGHWEQPTLSAKDFWQILKEAVGEAVSELSGWDVLLPILGGLQLLTARHEQGVQLIHRNLNRARQAARQMDRLLGGLESAHGSPGTATAWLSRVILDRVESKVGGFCMPYAVLIAAHVDFDLTAPDLAALPNNPALFPQSSTDTRFWLLSYLDAAVKYDVSTMAIAALDRLYLDGPPQLRRLG